MKSHKIGTRNKASNPTSPLYVGLKTSEFLTQVPTEYSVVSRPAQIKCQKQFTTPWAQTRVHVYRTRFLKN